MRNRDKWATEPGRPAVNQWLVQMQGFAELQRRSNRGKDPSDRDNADGRAEADGKLDVCALLISVPVTPQKLEEVRERLARGRPRSVTAKYLPQYRDGVAQMLKDCEAYLRGSAD